MIGYSLFGVAASRQAEESMGGSVDDGNDFTIKQIEWDKLFELSREQAVTALLCDAVLKLPKEQRPPKEVLFHLVSMSDTIENDNRVRHEALKSFHDTVMKPMNLPCVVVKGSSIAVRYPNPLHRECGDNDIYTGRDTGRLSEKLNSLGIAVDNKDPRHAAFSFHGVDFEAHTYLLYHNDEPEWTPVPMGSTGLWHLPIEEETFFLAKHIEHHAVFFHEMVRIRDLVDWCMLLRSPDFDFRRFRDLKRGSDVEYFAELMTSFCNLTFGLEMDCQLPGGLSADDFDKLYMQCPERHPSAIVRVARRSGKYIRYQRKYKILYGQSMFRRFYFRNIYVALRNLLYR